MEVQSVRSGPLSLPARGFISSSPSQSSSLVIYLKSQSSYLRSVCVEKLNYLFVLTDSGQRFDANVLGCTYSNGIGETVKLTDEDGCSLRPDLTTVFYKMKESTNPNTDLTLYTYFRVILKFVGK